MEETEPHEPPHSESGHIDTHGDTHADAHADVHRDAHANEPAPPVERPARIVDESHDETSAHTVAEPSELHDTGPHAPVTPTLALTFAIMTSVAIHRLSTRELFHRLSHLFPIAHAIVWCLALLTTAAWTATNVSSEWLIISTAIFLAITYIYSGWLRSVLAGVTLALERRLHIGDEILAGDLKGVITRFGLRAIHLRADDGSLHDVPNDLLVNTPVTNLTGDGGDSACDITLDIPQHVTHEHALEIVHCAAILSPLASPRHRPRAFLTPPTRANGPFRVTVRGYAFDPHHREHFQSDVLARATQRLSHGHAVPSSRNVVGYSGPSPDSSG